MADLRQQSYNAINAVYNQTLAAIKRIQGDKPYIDTQANLIGTKDRMYFYVYLEVDDNEMREGYIAGIRANGKSLEFLGSYQPMIFSDVDFEIASRNYDANVETTDCELCWQPIRDNEYIQLTPTLFSIAEVIEEYEG